MFSRVNFKVVSIPASLRQWWAGDMEYSPEGFKTYSKNEGNVTYSKIVIDYLKESIDEVSHKELSTRYAAFEASVIDKSLDTIECLQALQAFLDKNGVHNIIHIYPAAADNVNKKYWGERNPKDTYEKLIMYSDDKISFALFIPDTDSGIGVTPPHAHWCTTGVTLVSPSAYEYSVAIEQSVDPDTGEITLEAIRIDVIGPGACLEAPEFGDHMVVWSGNALSDQEILVFLYDHNNRVSEGHIDYKKVNFRRLKMDLLGEK